ncbi:MAG: DUF677 domain-containing protein [Saprospiraceae bacterium]|nr:DUF677 domain-containing protein [Saprospiraceae bacterium]
MKLGIQLRVTDLTTAQSYFERLGFHIHAQMEDTVCLMADGWVLWLTIEAKKRTGFVYALMDGQSGPFQDPDGVKFFPVDHFPEEGTQVSICGNFAGLSLEVMDLKESLRFYEALGFLPDSGGVEKGWISMKTDSGPDLALMSAGACPHIFHNPSVSYFKGKENMKIIERLRKTGVKLDEELTIFSPDHIVDNVVLVAPGPMCFFIFSD